MLAQAHTLTYSTYTQLHRNEHTCTWVHKFGTHIHTHTICEHTQTYNGISLLLHISMMARGVGKHLSSSILLHVHLHWTKSGSVGLYVMFHSGKANNSKKLIWDIILKLEIRNCIKL